LHDVSKHRPSTPSAGGASAPAPPGHAEGRGAFGGFVGPRTLVELVENTAPWLFDGRHPEAKELPESSGARVSDHGAHELGWWSMLRHGHLLGPREAPSPADITDYFALCLAAHFGSVATYVPTDVDAKIRHALWLDQTDPGELNRMGRLALATASYRITGVSRRTVTVDGFGVFSGHDGERLSVLGGGWIGHLNHGDPAGAEAFEAAIDAELTREARAFEALSRARGRELELLGLAAILAHNAGDVMQALGSKAGRIVPEERRARYADLVRERFERYGGAFGRAGALYRELLAAEGHRNYPLREVKDLRQSHELLLPMSPFLDGWGELVARWPGFDDAARARIVTGLVTGCRKVAGQEAYYRALAGFARAYDGGLEAPRLVEHFGTAVKRELKEAEMRRKLALRRESFESRYVKETRRIVDGAR
jgi:hypothetical protein